MLYLFRRIKRGLDNKRLKKILSKLKSIGKDCEINVSSTLVFPERIRIGSYVYIGPNAQLFAYGGIEVKTGTIIGPNVFIHSANHNFKNAAYLPYDEKYILKKVTIEENVWIAANVTITPGSHIGEGSIIGAGCVVSGSIPACSIVIGNPCKVISKRNEAEYYKLKDLEMFYLKYKKEGELVPDFNDGYIDF